MATGVAGGAHVPLSFLGLDIIIVSLSCVEPRRLPAKRSKDYDTLAACSAVSVTVTYTAVVNCVKLLT